MSVFRCGRFPLGVAHVRTAAGIVRFQDGTATVDDPTVAQALRAVPEAFAITEDGPDPASPPAPARRAPVAEWQQYAIARGADLEQVRAMTKAELIEAFGGD